MEKNLQPKKLQGTNEMTIGAINKTTAHQHSKLFWQIKAKPAFSAVAWGNPSEVLKSSRLMMHPEKMLALKVSMQRGWPFPPPPGSTEGELS